MSQRSRLRLVVLQVLVLSLMVTLFGRLYYLQVIAGQTYQRAAADNRIREIVLPATRGLILDDVGRPLAENRTTLVVSVDRTTVEAQPHDGVPELKRLARTLGLSYSDVYDAIQLCGTPGAKPPPVCWNGSPYQPIPVAKDVVPTRALAVLERNELYPGITAGLEAVRDYPMPDGANAAQMIGFLGPVTAQELKAQQAKGGGQLQATDLVGRAGLEEEYDSYLRGVTGTESVAVNQAGSVEGTVGTVPSVPGDYVVTTSTRSCRPRSRRSSPGRSRRTARPRTSRGRATTRPTRGAAVVLDTQTGAVLAMASYPTYNPNVWVGGVSQKELEKLYSRRPTRRWCRARRRACTPPARRSRSCPRRQPSSPAPRSTARTRARAR